MDDPPQGAGLEGTPLACEPAADVWRSFSRGHKLQDLQQVEARVTDHRRHDRSPSQVDDAPEGAEQSRDDPGVVALQDMADAEHDAGHHHSHDASTQPDLEAMQQERALNLLADASRDDHDHGEQPRVTWRADETFERILFNRVQPRRDAPYREQYTHAGPERDDDQRNAVRELAGNRPLAEEYVTRMFAVRAEEEQDETDEHDGIDERQPGNEPDL